MMTIKCILFDMDGLLVDTEPLFAKAVIKALKKQNIELTLDEFCHHWTRKGNNALGYAMEKGMKIDIETYRMERTKEYRKLIGTEPKPMNGARSTVKKLSNQYVLGLVTSSGTEDTLMILESISIKKYFRTIVTCDDVQNAKPAPDGFVLAAKLLGYKAHDCVVIEDAEKGVLAAKNAGMKVIAVPNEHTKNNDFRNAQRKLTCLKELTRELIETI